MKTPHSTFLKGKPLVNPLASIEMETGGWLGMGPSQAP